MQLRAFNHRLYASLKLREMDRGNRRLENLNIFTKNTNSLRIFMTYMYTIVITINRLPYTRDFVINFVRYNVKFNFSRNERRPSRCGNGCIVCCLKAVGREN